MSLTEGTQLGVYEINGKIGAGGMGEVYRATDTKLGREVAIKTLPAGLADDPDRLARFEREAKLLASLNHAHIASVHSLDEHEGTLYIAMELVEGQTLEETLKTGPLGVDDALQVSLQIASALEAAPEKGVVHRDLKPANIMVNAEGQVNVLDFGLAKAFSGDPTEASPGQSPALSVAMTQQGLILGTAGYMSPEQASGQATDQRADVWAFGVVLYEMLTGQALFSGESVAHILGGVLRLDPDWDQLPASLDPRLQRVLERCLKKRPRERYHAIADVRIDIEEILHDPAGAAPVSVGQAAAAPVSGFRRFAQPIAMLFVGAAVAGIAFWYVTLSESSPGLESRAITRFEHVIPGVEALRNPLVSFFALSPDGRRFVYNTTQGLRLREMDALETRVVAGTEGNSAYPFFSPDSRSIAYLAFVPERGYRRIGVEGGASVRVALGADFTPAGASWNEDGSIFFSIPEGIFRVPATGGAPELMIAPAADGERLFAPRMLPDGDSLLFGVSNLTSTDGQIVVQSLTNGDRTTLITGGGDARYVPTGHIVYAFGDGLYGIAFDLETLSVSGGSVPLVQGVMRGTVNSDANFGIGANGTLAYVSGTAAGTPRTVVWVDREGREEPIALPPHDYQYVQLSPDGTRLALDARDEESDIWIWDLGREVLQRLTFDPGLNRGPVWSPDGERVVFSRNLGSSEEIYWQAADGSGTPDILTTDSGRQVFPNDVTPDGSGLLFMDTAAPRDIWLATIGDTAEEPVPLIATPANEVGAQVSPDGRWLAYQSDESGRDEIYVRPFPNVDEGRWQISTGGGTRPLWSRDGSELFYFLQQSGPAPGAVMAVAITADSSFRASAPEKLFEGDYQAPNDSRQVYDVSLDNQRFLMIKNFASDDFAEATRIVVIENWSEELRRLVPTD